MQKEVTGTLTVEFEPYCDNCENMELCKSRTVSMEDKAVLIMACKNAQTCETLYQHLKEREEKKQRHGHWIINEFCNSFRNMTCSECESVFDPHDWKGCPMCLSIMDGKKRYKTL